MNNATAITAMVAGIWTVYRHFEARSADRRRADFEAFHKMINSIPTSAQEQISPPVALATIYELRNYPQYFDVTSRILKLFETSIPKNLPEKSFASIAYKAMTDEIKRTLDYIGAQKG
jgi:hypothetical protein